MITHKTLELLSEDGRTMCAVWCADPTDQVPEMEAQRMVPKRGRGGKTIGLYRFPRRERVHIACMEVWSQWSDVMVSEKCFAMLKHWMLMQEAQNATKH